MNEEKHWMYEYFDRDWTYEYDCFAHFAEVQKDHFNVNELHTLQHIPEVLNYGAALDYVKTHDEVEAMWQKVDTPKHGDAIVFGGGTMKFHIGTYLEIDAGGVLHCEFGRGVMFTPMVTFRQRFIEEELVLRYMGK
jgi:hypothetical protein